MKAGVLDFGKNWEDVRSTRRAHATVSLAGELEEAGATRYWIAEHHVPDVAIRAPEVVLPAIAEATSSIRVGAGGVLLRYYSPLRIQEIYFTLSNQFPGRVDLGIARGPGVTDREIALALVDGHADELTEESHERKTLELARRVAHSDEPFPPRLWLLGRSERTAALAARLGAGFACDALTEPALDGAGERLSAFTAERTDALIAVTVACAPSTSEALAIDHRARDHGLTSAVVTGSVSECDVRIREIARRCSVTEVLLACVSPSQSDQHQLVPLVRSLSSS